VAFLRFREEWAMKTGLVVTLLLLHWNIVGCAGSRHYRTLDEGGTPGAPHFLDLHQAAQIATLHFPAGTYVLEAADDAGFFFRSPSPIRENSFSGSLFHRGGLYLSNSRHRSLRGYVYWHGGLTHVGNLSRADYALRD
jgi:hypothetical protein